MPFDISVFTDRLKMLFLNSPLFPDMKGDYVNEWGVTQSDRSKHPKREPLKLKKATEDSINSSMTKIQDMVTFDIGNEQMEKTHPYYHILENTPYIRKKDRGTAKTKGSQAKVENLGHRDYERVEWNGKTFKKEYSKNIRGSRNRLDSVSHFITDSKGNRKMINRESSSYLNEHYRYIERILDSGILVTLAEEQGLKLAPRKIDTGLAEEYFGQLEQPPLNILDIIASHEGE